MQGLRPSAITFVGASLRAVPARGREAVCPPHKLPVFVGVWDPKVSQPLRRQSPPAPTRQTASRPNPPLRYGASMVWRLCAGLPHQEECLLQPGTPRQRPAPDTPNHRGQTGDPRPCVSADAGVVPRPGDGIKDKHIPQGAAAEAAAASLLEFIKEVLMRVVLLLSADVPHVPLY